MSGEPWEYATDVVGNAEMPRLRHVLNWRGSEGWELVSLAPRVKPVIGAMQGGDFVLVFKRHGLGSFDLAVVHPPEA